MFVRISPLDFETHENRNSEKREGKIPSITRRSKLILMESWLMSMDWHCGPIILNDGSENVVGFSHIKCLSLVVKGSTQNPSDNLLQKIQHSSRANS